MKAILERVHFENPTDLDVKRLQKIIEENDLTPADIKYRFSKLYDWQIKIVNPFSGDDLIGARQAALRAVTQLPFAQVRLFLEPLQSESFTCPHL